MADPWTISDWHNVYPYGPDSKFRIGLYEIIRGIWERQEAFGAAPGFSVPVDGVRARFILPDGTGSSNFSYSDMHGMPITGTFGNNIFSRNLDIAVTCIRDMLSAYYSVSLSGVTKSATIPDRLLDVSDLLLYQDILDDVGYDILNPTKRSMRHMDPLFWNSIQAYLDKILWYTWNVSLTPSPGDTVGTTYWSGEKTTISQAWSDRFDIEFSSIEGYGGLFPAIRANYFSLKNSVKVIPSFGIFFDSLKRPDRLGNPFSYIRPNGDPIGIQIPFTASTYGSGSFGYPYSQASEQIPDIGLTLSVGDKFVSVPQSNSAYPPPAFVNLGPEYCPLNSPNKIDCSVISPTSMPYPSSGGNLAIIVGGTPQPYSSVAWETVLRYGSSSPFVRGRGRLFIDATPKISNMGTI